MQQSRLTGAISVTAAQAVVLVLGYITHLWIGRVLGPASYGIYGVVLSIQTIFGLLLTLGVPIAISRFVAQDEQHAQSTLWQALRIQGTIAILVAILTFTLSPLIAQLLNDTSLTNYIRFVALILLVQAGYPIFIQFLSGMHFFNRQAALTTIYAVAKLAGALSLIYFFDVYGAFAGFAVGGIIAAIVGWFWTRKVGGNEKRKLPIKTFLSFAGIYVLILAGLQLLISLDLFMVKAILKDDVQAGYYNAAVTLSRISYLLLQAISFILLPSVSALTKPGASHEEAVAFIRKTLRYLIALIIPSVALAAATSKSLILLFFSEQYIPASSVLSILMIGLGSLAFYLLLANISAGAGKAKAALIITIILLVISAALGIILIPRFGIIGAAWQTTITGIIGLIILSTYTFKTFKIHLPYKSTINVILASTIAVLPTYLWKVHPFTLPLQYIALGALYILTLYLLREITDEDRQLIANLHPSLQRLAPKND